METEVKMDWSASDDKEVALALKQGDARALEEMVRRYQGRVYAVAFRLSGNREDALDLSQEAFIKAYQRIDAWQPTGSFLPWLLRLTTNLGIDFLRRRKRRPQERYEDYVTKDSEHAAVEPVSMETGRLVHAKEIDERIRAALTALSESQRTVFVLRHFEGLPLSDIALEMGCTTGSVKVHLFRALKKMQKELRDLHEP